MLPWGKKAENVRKAEELLSECCQRLDLDQKRFGKTGREWVARRSWDEGNAEMRRLIYYAALVSSDRVIEAIHFPPRRILDHEAFTRSSFENVSLEGIVDQKVGHFFERLGKVEARGVYHTVMRQIERPLIKRCLDWAEGNQVKAARILGINRNTLRKKMKELGIE